MLLLDNVRPGEVRVQPRFEFAPEFEQVFVGGETHAQLWHAGQRPGSGSLG